MTNCVYYHTVLTYKNYCRINGCIAVLNANFNACPICQGNKYTTTLWYYYKLYYTKLYYTTPKTEIDTISSSRMNGVPSTKASVFFFKELGNDN